MNPPESPWVPSQMEAAIARLNNRPYVQPSRNQITVNLAKYVRVSIMGCYEELLNNEHAEGRLTDESLQLWNLLSEHERALCKSVGRTETARDVIIKYAKLHDWALDNLGTSAQYESGE